MTQRIDRGFLRIIAQLAIPIRIPTFFLATRALRRDGYEAMLFGIGGDLDLRFEDYFASRAMHSFRPPRGRTGLLYRGVLRKVVIRIPSNVAITANADMLRFVQIFPIGKIVSRGGKFFKGRICAKRAGVIGFPAVLRAACVPFLVEDELMAIGIGLRPVRNVRIRAEGAGIFRVTAGHASRFRGFFVHFAILRLGYGRIGKKIA